MYTRILLVCLITLILIPIVNSQEAGLDTFDEKLSIAPPELPERLDRFEATFTLQDFVSRSFISDVHVQIELVNLDTNENTKTLQYIDESGILKLSLNSGNYFLVLLIDELETQGKDYFAETSLTIIENTEESLFVLPVGSVRGFVYDDNNAVRGSKVKFDCSADHGVQDQVQTDSFGSYANDWLPVGSCRISAEYSKKIGYKDIKISKGALINQDITLNKGLISKSYTNLIIGIIVLVGLIGIIIKLKQKKLPQKKYEKQEPKLSRRTLRMRQLEEKEIL